MVIFKDGLGPPEFFYRVVEYVTTFEKDPAKNKPFEHTTDFREPDLLKLKLEATQFYNEREQGLNDARYFLPYAAKKDLALGQDAAFSITLCLVEYYNDDYYFEHPLMGDDEEDEAESREIEDAALQTFYRERGWY
ncbi:MAG: hypothetical protein WKF97_02985 [Chitinophagaceae bacterium]